MESFLDQEERKEWLRGVTRYSMYVPMFYRTNLWTHSKHVAWLTEEIVRVAQQVFGDVIDGEKARLMALIHDDHEIIMGDIQAGNKAVLTSEQTASLEEKEAQAIKEISARFPECLGKYRYEDLLKEANAVTSLEAIIVKYADKYEALGEALHELFAGNPAFNTAVITEYGHPPTPFAYYTKWFNAFPDRYPDMKPLLVSGHALFSPVDQSIDLDVVVRKGKPHTFATFGEPTGYSPYDTWKDIIRKHATDEDVFDLTRQTEFYD